MQTVFRLNDFKFNRLQATIFSQTSWTAGSRILSKILSLFPDQFDDAPTVLPIPPEAPPEFPRTILRSKDKQWLLEITAKRLNYRWNQMADAHQQTFAHFLGSFDQFLPAFLDIEHALVGRIGIVASRYFVIEHPALILSRHFCKDEWLQKALPDSEAFELHQLRKTKLEQMFDVNSWVRFKSGHLTIPDTPVRPIILVEQDVNTLAEKAGISDYKKEEIMRFGSLAEQEMEQRFRSFLEG